MSKRPKSCRIWKLANKPVNMPTLTGDEATFKLEKVDVPPLAKGQVLLKALYYSNDPAQRAWIDANIPRERLYTAPAEVGEAMRARGLGEVIESASDKVATGSVVRAVLEWREYVVLDGDAVQMLEPLANNLSLTHYLGILGSTGLTAYYGLLEVGEARKGDKVLVSGAAGATGNVVVQIAKKIVGVENVIGIAGTDDKCRWVESLGADQCLNYKSPTFHQDLIEATKGGVDLCFDNVGGEILDQMLGRMSLHGRVVACGAISGYNSDAPTVLHNYFQVISMRIHIRGFIVMDYAADKAAECQRILRRAIEDGTLRMDADIETIVPTRFEDVPQTWLRLFSGKNTGKLLTKLV